MMVLGKFYKQLHAFTGFSSMSEHVGKKKERKDHNLLLFHGSVI